MAVAVATVRRPSRMRTVHPPAAAPGGSVHWQCVGQGAWSMVSVVHVL